MNTFDWKINVVEKLIEIFHRMTGAEEYHHFLILILLQESEK
jgi:hypothetical protein